MTTYCRHNFSTQPYMGAGTAASLVVHALLGVSVIYGAQYKRTVQAAFDPIMVEMAFESGQMAPALPQISGRQIVSPPDRSAEERPNPEARYLSDRDAFTVREQIKRGQGEDAGAHLAPDKPGGSLDRAPKPSAAAKQTSPQPQKQKLAALDLSRHGPAKSPPDPIKHLFLDDKELAKQTSSGARATSNETLRAAISSGALGSGDAQRAASQSQPFSRASGSGARILGMSGSMDFLPHLPDGDITLLNTKANIFAVFVRRVAVQVFSQMRSSGWDVLRAQDILAISRDSSVSAVLSPQGALLRVVLDSSSGSARFDEVLIDAVRRGAKDPNPPPSAALQDGNVHFVFRARSWVRFVGDPRSGAPMERRWLMLATGLE